MGYQDDNEDFVDGDIPLEDVDWAKVEKLQSLIDNVDSIADDDIRLSVARELVKEMNNG